MNNPYELPYLPNPPAALRRCLVARLWRSAFCSQVGVSEAAGGRADDDRVKPGISAIHGGFDLRELSQNQPNYRKEKS